MWVNIIVAIVFFFSLIGGLKEGAVKNFFSLIAVLIAIPLTGISYHLLSSILSFLPGENWGNFIGFFITLAIISVILHFIFFLPRKLTQKAWSKGFLFRFIGGVFNILNSAIGMVLFTLVILAYPIFGWLEEALIGSSILTWLVVNLSFVKSMLPDIFHDAAITVSGGTALGF